MGLESCSAGPPGGTRVPQKRGEQVDSDAKSPEEPDWSADDGSNIDEDYHEEHIDWALLSQEEGEGSGAGISLGPPVMEAIVVPLHRKVRPLASAARPSARPPAQG